MEKFKAIEVGTTWQGEGPDVGRWMTMIRFKDCNLKCPFCDTHKAMENYVEGEYSIDQIKEIVSKKQTGMLITGGEPTLDKYRGTVRLLVNNTDCDIYNIETNGHKLRELSRELDKSNVKMIYSPKFFGEEDEGLGYAFRNLQFVREDPRVYYKIVYGGLHTSLLSVHQEIEKFCGCLNDYKMNKKVYIMPEGRTSEEVIKSSRTAMELASKFNFNFS